MLTKYEFRTVLLGQIAIFAEAASEIPADQLTEMTAIIACNGGFGGEPLADDGASSRS